ncbi:hypothetical protein [Thalassotalea sp. PLHSN55]|uniref:hypothetical protein n=1 Tax=Thalassotalea sp. PLHSN55 TaxID=3435888 RepID=UPI003F834BF1
MKYLKVHWRQRVFLLSLVSVSISLLMISLELTDWAQQINELGFSHGDNENNGKSIPSAMRYILPFVKELVLIGVPMGLALLWLKILRKLKHKFK